MQIRRMVCQKASIFCTSCIQTVSKQQNSKICTNKILQSSVFLSCTNKILIYNGVAERLFTWFDGNNIRDWIFDTANTKLCFTGHQQWPANTKIVFIILADRHQHWGWLHTNSISKKGAFLLDTEMIRFSVWANDGGVQNWCQAVVRKWGNHRPVYWFMLNNVPPKWLASFDTRKK